MSIPFKTIDKSYYTSCGYIKKTHGVHGQVTIQFDQGMDNILFDQDFIFIQVEGLMVPFFWEEYKINSTITAYVKFEGIDEQETAKALVSNALMIKKEWVDEEVDMENGLDNLKGFCVYDQSENIGVILGVEDFSGNVVLNVLYNGEERYIPFNHDFLIEIVDEYKIVRMDLPEGLLE